MPTRIANAIAVTATQGYAGAPGQGGSLGQGLLAIWDMTPSGGQTIPNQAPGQSALTLQLGSTVGVDTNDPQPYQEASRKGNQLIWSEDQSNAVWVKSGATVAANVTAAPDSTSTADDLVEDVSNGQHTTYEAFTTAAVGLVMTFSVYAKDAGRRYIVLYTQNTGLAASVGFDLVSGTIYSAFIGGAQYLNSGMIPVGNGWYRCSITFTCTNTTVYNVVYLAAPGGGAGITNNYQGDGASAIYLWGAQLEYGSAATAYQRADAASPATTPVTGFVTDDYILSPTIPQLSMAGDWTVYLCGKFDGTLTNTGVLSIADPTSSTVYQWAASHGSGLLFAASSSGGATSDLTVPTTVYCVIRFGRSGTTLTLSRLDTGASMSITSTAIAGTPRIGLAAMVRSTIANITNSLKLALPVLLYNRATTASEDATVYRWYKQKAAQVGLPLS